MSFQELPSSLEEPPQEPPGASQGHVCEVALLYNFSLKDNIVVKTFTAWFDTPRLSPRGFQEQLHRSLRGPSLEHCSFPGASQELPGASQEPPGASQQRRGVSQKHPRASQEPPGASQCHICEVVLLYNVSLKY